MFYFLTEVDFSAAFVNSSLTILVHAGASYFNIYFLFPKLLKQKHYLVYAFTLILTVALACFVLAIAFYAFSAISATKSEELLQRRFLIATAISVSYTLAITMSLKLVKQWYERERLTADLTRINMETELKYLKSQINPHFLFNSLNSLYALTLKKSDLAPEMVLKLSDILRYVLYDGGAKWVDLEKELNYIKSYLDLEKLRHGDRLKVNLDVNKSTLGATVAPMLFLTFIENSFKHGISQKAEGGFLNISISSEDDAIHFSICNSKPRSKATHINGSQGGIGLENVKKRLNLLYPNRHELLINDGSDAYCVDLKLINKIPHNQLEPAL